MRVCPLEDPTARALGVVVCASAAGVLQGVLSNRATGKRRTCAPLASRCPGCGSSPKARRP